MGRPVTVIGTSINMPLSVLSLVLLARTAAGSTSPALIPLLRHEHAILVRVGPYRDGKHDPTSPQCVEAITLSIQPEGGMRAVDKSPVDASGSSAEPAFKTTGSRLRTSYAPQEAAVGTSDGVSDADVGLDVASIGDVGLLAALGLSGEPAPAPAASPDGAPN